MNDPAPMAVLEKLATGIEGFDDITGGGIPRGRTTLFMGGPGCGKTVLALQVLVHGAAHHEAPGIFVACEENANRVRANAESFGWNIAGLPAQHLYFLNAQLSPDVVMAGAFDLTGLLTGLEAQAREMGAKLIVFDALDVLLSLLDDPAAERRELYRIHDWLARTGLTGIITAKVEDESSARAHRHGFLQFMADCAVMLRQRVANRVAIREMRVVKYRGSSHVLNEVPFVIAGGGLEVGSSNGVHPEPQPFTDRISTGIVRLDEMLDGGLYRGTNALITGSAGTGKSTLSGLFLEAACRRGERALFVSFDENARDIVRDLASVGVKLEQYIESGLLQMVAVRTASAGSEDHLMRIKRLLREYQPTCVAIDPFSALTQVGGEFAVRNIAERLICFCRNARITLLFTSLLEGEDAAIETTPLHLSTLADTWMQISYALQGGERNRGLTIIKSRGSKHSNQMRELVFSDTGITLADPYTAGGEVLMGTLRIEKENCVRAEQGRLQSEIEQKGREIELIQVERDLRVEAIRRDLQIRDLELGRLKSASRKGREDEGLRQDATVRKRDSKLVHAQADGDRPDGGPPVLPNGRKKPA